MKHPFVWWGGLLVCVLVIIGLLFKISALESRIRGMSETNAAAMTALQNSLKRAQAEAQAAKDLGPGLGEYMTTIQLHAGKLWFAAKAANWELAQYELDELKETMESAKGLNAEKNGVKISNVLDSVLKTQVAQLAQVLKKGNSAEFQKSYDEMLSACNGCHTAAAYKFIQIIRPTAPPVTNQRW
jgi:hypothetical protein